ncbi:MAG: hypothetical protein MR660_07030 [Peptoniphilaceae bacterium]|nr:hypothetical protein [Peptoniphilaceae bacterium]MDY4197013.1 hypothetical protein [Peptoniphilaceae bacterium]MDY5841774.1 hypothetical protein [Peptoniphilaceae bacterium]MDY6147315.1 hypothetical protein [Peptoniphilaceae bacterium]
MIWYFQERRRWMILRWILLISGCAWVFVPFYMTRMDKWQELFPWLMQWRTYRWGAPILLLIPFLVEAFLALGERLDRKSETISHSIAVPEGTHMLAKFWSVMTTALWTIFAEYFVFGLMQQEPGVLSGLRELFTLRALRTFGMTALLTFLFMGMWTALLFLFQALRRWTMQRWNFGLQYHRFPLFLLDVLFSTALFAGIYYLTMRLTLRWPLYFEIQHFSLILTKARSFSFPSMLYQMLVEGTMTDALELFLSQWPVSVFVVPLVTTTLSLALTTGILDHRIDW